MPDFRDAMPDPEVELALAVIDATLAGEPVAPEDADLAELALLLVGERPAIRPEFARQLDERARDRFQAPAPGRASVRSRALRVWLPSGAAALAAAVIALVVIVPRSHPGSGSSVSAGTVSSSSTASASASAGRAAVPARLPSHAAGGRTGPALGAPKTLSSAGSSALSPSTASIPAAAPSTIGRQVVQSAQISLATTPGRVDAVAQAVFNVATQVHAVVESSTVTSTGTPAGSAQIQLSVPSSNLQAAMSALSNISGASVVSRTDASQDITGQVGAAGRRLADDRALRRSLLRQLANATTTAQIDSLQARLKDVEGQIASDQGKLNALHHQVDNSQVSVQVNASMAGGQGGSGGGLTLRRSLHDAARVLVVAAGVALIAAAVALPLGLLAILLGLLGGVVRRRRREQALDLI